MTQLITGNRIANNSITSNNLLISDVFSANNLTTFVQLYTYDLDDVSYLTDGFLNIFPLTYNTSNVSVPSPWNLMVTVSGIMQSAYANTAG
jgi:hypothetical protein